MILVQQYRCSSAENRHAVTFLRISPRMQDRLCTADAMAIRCDRVKKTDELYGLREIERMTKSRDSRNFKRDFLEISPLARREYDRFS